MTEVLAGQKDIGVGVDVGVNSQPGPELGQAYYAAALEKMASMPEPKPKRKSLTEALREVADRLDKEAEDHMNKASQIRTLLVELQASPAAQAAFDLWGRDFMVGEVGIAVQT